MKGILGHENVKASLHQALVKNQLPHALLFVGPEGVGKWKTAQALAQTLLCQESHVDFCGLCASCLQVQKGQHQGLHLLNTENAQIKIDEAREILRKLTLRNWDGARLVLINDAHKLNPQAANALLKVIEEPPEQTYFILITSQPGKILSTIRSRTQMIRFGPLSEGDLKKITGASGWVLAAANGSVTRVEQLLGEESEDMRRTALTTLVNLLSSDHSYLQWTDSLQAVIKDKQMVEIVLSTWLQMLRDLRVHGMKPAFHSDLLPELCQIPMGDLSRLDEVFAIVTAMRDELDFNVDRQLLFESGFLKIRQVFCSDDEGVFA